MSSTTPDPREKNTKEQYEALGRFVEAFEGMVHEAREVCIELISRDPRHGGIVEIAFHHGALTAKPTFEIMRAVVAEIVADAQRPENPESDIPDLWSPLVTTPDDEPLRLTPAEGELFLAAMKTIADEYNALTNMRNNLLHATWFIGHPDLPTPFGSEFFVRKFTTTKSGLSALDLPKNAGDLLALAARCDEIAAWIAVLARCVFGVYKIHDAFRKRDDELFLLIEGGETTLPKK